MTVPTSLDSTAESAESLRVLRLLINSAVQLGDTDAIVHTIQRDLAKALESGRIRLGADFSRVKSGSYARRLLFREVEKGYTVVVMTWAPGQETPIHDHAGIWCVEGVVQGEIDVTRYRVELQTGQLLRFSGQASIRAGIGSTGSLIPPDEYHAIANTTDSTAITLHVYGGEMDHCNVYTPRPDGWHERAPHALTYDS